MSFEFYSLSFRNRWAVFVLLRVSLFTKMQFRIEVSGQTISLPLISPRRVFVTRVLIGVFRELGGSSWMFRISIGVIYSCGCGCIVYLATSLASAGNSTCLSNGSVGSGCSCQPVVCSTDNVTNHCYMYRDCDDLGCVTEAPGIGSYQTAEQQNATTCVGSGPLVGGGCSSNSDSYCKKLRTCKCGAFGGCEIGEEEEAGLYSVCEAL